MKDLKELTIRGGSARIVAQVSNFSLRIGSVMILSRLLEPRDFGLLGMVTAFTGVLSLFRDFGLSAASVQRATVTREQTSTLFWINVLVGTVLTVIAISLAPAVATFYREPRLLWVTYVVAISFLFNGAGVQHSAILQRQMRFTSLAWIDIVALVISTAIAIGGAKAGYGYWALAAMAVSLPLTTTIGLWLVSRWLPGMPRRGCGIRSMMRFGGTVTLNSIVVYIAFNFDKVLLGRFWGAEILGMYGRAYQLIRIPTDNLNSAIGEVAFSALSRIQDDASRLKRYFLKGYSLVLALTLPITIACGLFAEDIVIVLLGSKWKDAAAIFRLLAPTIVIFAIMNPLGWLLTSLGRVGRSLKIASVMAPVMIVGYLIGLPYGPKGVALVYSTLMSVFIIPVIIWAVRDTEISSLDVFTTIGRPLVSGLVAGAIALVLRFSYQHLLSSFPRLIVEVAILFSLYLAILLYVMDQKSFYLDLFRTLRRRSSGDQQALASTG